MKNHVHPGFLLIRKLPFSFSLHMEDCSLQSLIIHLLLHYCNVWQQFMFVYKVLFKFNRPVSLKVQEDKALQISQKLKTYNLANLLILLSFSRPRLDVATSSVFKTKTKQPRTRFFLFTVIFVFCKQLRLGSQSKRVHYSLELKMRHTFFFYVCPLCCHSSRGPHIFICPLSEP